MLEMGLQPPGLPRACQRSSAYSAGGADHGDQGPRPRPHQFFADHSALADEPTFKQFLAPLRKIEWVVCTKNPFAGPEQVLR